MLFAVGQVFENDYSVEAAAWCNENRAYIAEIEPKDGVRRFQIVAVPEPTEEEIRTREITARRSELQAYLNDTDWYVVRAYERDVPIPQEVLEKRQSARDEIDALRAELAAIA